MIRTVMIAAMLGLLAVAAQAEVVPQAPIKPDKSQYTLFDPTPREAMRPLAADRPDGTETPITVDAGHVQVETSLFTYSYNHDAGERTRSWSVFDSALKIGLTNNSDLQLLFEAYRDESVRSSGMPTTRERGLSDVMLRLKINLWGNDPAENQSTAFGVMPFIKIPTGAAFSNDHVEGGVIFMFAWDVAETWGLGFMAETAAVYDDTNDRHEIENTHTAVLGFEIHGPLGGYIEYIGTVNSIRSQGYQAVFSTGVTYELHENMLLDMGTRVGMTEPAEDLVVFLGITVRY